MNSISLTPEDKSYSCYANYEDTTEAFAYIKSYDTLGCMSLDYIDIEFNNLTALGLKDYEGETK